MVKEKVNKLVEDYRESVFTSPYVFVEESEHKLIREIKEYNEEKQRQVLKKLYSMGADKNSVEEQVTNEEKEFGEEYNKHQKLKAKISFALIEVIQQKTI